MNKFILIFLSFQFSLYAQKESLKTKVDSIMYSAIRLNAFPGAQIVVLKDGEEVLNKSYGYHTYDSINKVTTNSIYDLASITKPTAGAFALMSLYEDDLIDINSPLSNYVKYFKNTPTRIEGVGLYVIEKEISQRIKHAFSSSSDFISIKTGGDYRWRRDGESHILNPNTISKLQNSVRQESFSSFKEFSKLVNDQEEQLMTIRGLLKFVDFNPIPIEEVEPWTEIVKRFKTGAMSYGSISKEAHENLAIAMNRIGGKSNSGEGGEDSDSCLLYTSDAADE